MPKKIGFIIIAIYLFFGSGYIDFFDATSSIETALSIVENGRLGTEIAHPLLYKQGRYGYWYTKLGLSLPVLYLPSVLISKFFSRLGISEKIFRHFLISLTNSLITAFITILIYVFFRLKVEHKKALFWAIIGGFGTGLLPYSKTTLREPLQALCLLGAFIFLSQKKPFLAGVFTAVGLLTKQAFVIFLVPILILLFFENTKKRILFFIPVFLSVLIWMAYSFYAWSNPLDTGYSDYVIKFNSIVWKYPFFKGLWLELFSLDKGLFIYNPILIFFPIMLFYKIISKKISISDWAILISVIIQSVLYAKWYSPVGDAALGSRYSLVFIPLMIIFFEPEIVVKKFVKYGFIFVAVFSIFFQVVQSSVKIQQYYTFFNEAKREPSITHWQANFIFFTNKLKGNKEVDNLKSFGINEDKIVDLSRFKSLDGFNYWWLHIWKLYKTSNKT